MVRQKNLSASEEKLWQRVTENIAKLDSNRTARPLVRRGAYRDQSTPLYDHNISFAPGLTEQSFTLKDADHNWHQKIRRGKVKTDGKIDLHGMTQDRAFVALSRYIEDAWQRGKKTILVVTGKGGQKSDMESLSHSDYSRGRGVLKTNVPRWLSQGQLASRIISYHTANVEHGGDGALYVILKRNRG